MSAPASATRSALRSAVTVAVWLMRVAAYVTHGLASVLDVAAAHADAARGHKPPAVTIGPGPQPQLPGTS